MDVADVSEQTTADPSTTAGRATSSRPTAELAASGSETEVGHGDRELVDHPLRQIITRLRREDGQTTAEYALVLLGVAAIAMLLLAWARSTGTITGLFDAVLQSIIDLVP